MEQDFTEILREFLAENSISQSEFARKIGIHQSQVSEWLRGKAKPGYDNLKAMATAFGVSADYFLGITDLY